MLEYREIFRFRRDNNIVVVIKWLRMIIFHDNGDDIAKVIGNVVPVHATKEYRRVGIAPPIPNLDNRWK